VHWLQKDETTFDLDDMELKDRWQYYVSSYIRVEPTEGVSRNRLSNSLLMRNMPSGAETSSEDGTNLRKALVFSEDLILRICVHTFKIIYRQPGSEYYLYTDNPLTWDHEKNVSHARLRLQKFEDARNQKFRENFHMNNSWMKGLNHDQVQKITLDCKKWIDEGILPGTAAPANGSTDQ
jgi:paired amphipathic helix protein Sin3a